MSEENKNTETIDVFDGWENPGDDNFLVDTLGNEVKETETTKIVKEALNDTLIDPPAEGEESEEELEAKKKLADKTFEDWNDDEDSPSTDVTGNADEEEEEEPQKLNNVSLLNSMKEKGLLNYELEEGQELTEELAEELLEDKFDESLEERVEQTLKGLPASVKELVRYSLKGGDPDALMSQMVSQPSNKITEKTDITDEKNQIAVVRAARKEKGEDDETVESYIEFLKESGKLEGVAKKEFDAVIEKKKNFLKSQADAQAQHKEAQKKKQRKFKQELSEFINDEKIPVKLSRQERREIPDYMADPTVEMENGNKISQMQSDLFEALADKEKSLKLAKLLRSNFNFDDFIADAKTEEVKKLKGTVQAKKRQNRSSQPKEKKSLADLLD